MKRQIDPPVAPKPVEYRKTEVVLSKIDSVLKDCGKLGWHLVGVSPTDKTSQKHDATRGFRLYLLVFKR